MFFFLIPYATDAPIYHIPVMTIILVCLNVMVFAMQLAFGDAMNMFMLDFSTINPLQWVTANFMHADFGHIIGNLMFLGIFGIIVEGKIGWWKFLILYLACGTIAWAITQVIMNMAGQYGFGLGASCAIFAIMAVALFWAPENEISFNVILIVLFRFFFFTFELSVLITAFGFIAWNFLIAAVTKFEMSSATLHLIGVLPGILFGIAMLKFRMVDCEGFDLLSIVSGKRGKRLGPTKEELEEERQQRIEAKQKALHELNHGLKMVNQYANVGQLDVALKRFSMLKKQHPSAVLPEFASSKLIKHYLSKEGDRKKAVPLMESYITNYPSKKIPMTLSLAKLYVVLQARPKKGINLLKTIPRKEMTPQQTEFFNKLVIKAKQMIDEGILEVDDQE